MERLIAEIKEFLSRLVDRAIEYWSSIKKYLPKHNTPVHPAKRNRMSFVNELKPQVILNKPMYIMARSHC